MEIGTFIAGSVDSELSGNVIDLCPVGALTSKPFRFRARAWEMVQRDGVAPHDPVGSNNPSARAPRPGHARGAARERGDQRGVDLRPGSLRVRGPVQRRPGALADGQARRDVAGRGLLGGGARCGGGRAARGRGGEGRGRARGAGLGVLHGRGALPLPASGARPRQRQRRSPRAPARLLRPGRGAGVIPPSEWGWRISNGSTRRC